MLASSGTEPVPEPVPDHCDAFNKQATRPSIRRTAQLRTSLTPATSASGPRSTSLPAGTDSSRRSRAGCPQDGDSSTGGWSTVRSCRCPPVGWKSGAEGQGPGQDLRAARSRTIKPGSRGSGVSGGRAREGAGLGSGEPAEAGRLGSLRKLGSREHAKAGRPEVGAREAGAREFREAGAGEVANPGGREAGKPAEAEKPGWAGIPGEPGSQKSGKREVRNVGGSPGKSAVGGGRSTSAGAARWRGRFATVRTGGRNDQPARGTTQVSLGSSQTAPAWCSGCRGGRRPGPL